MLLRPDADSDGVTEATRSASPASSRTDAWVLLGSLDAAFFQSGVVGVWLETLPVPRAIFAGGASALNALLALSNDPLAFRTGWERLRAGHVLATMAAARSPFLSFLRNGHDHEPMDSVRSLARAEQARSHAALHVLVAGCFVESTAGGDGMASLIDESLRVTPEASALGSAIDLAIAEGARRILVPGIEERSIGERDVVRALEDARTHHAEVMFLPLSTRQRPGVVGYLLPGLGRADRLWCAGRRAALRWLESAVISGGAAAQRI